MKKGLHTWKLAHIVIPCVLNCVQYTTARKDYIHKIVFSDLTSRKITSQLHKNMFLELIPRKLHCTYLFVIQEIAW